MKSRALRRLPALALAACLSCAATTTLTVVPTARAAFLIEVDIDGADDGVLTFSPNFSFGGDTTTASQSAASPAVGMTGGDSIFGGDGVGMPDTYVFSYTPSTTAGDLDNLSLDAGTALNVAGDTATGIAGGTSGTYVVYATWPFTQNVSGGLTTFEMTHAGGLLSVQIDQNGGGDGTGNEWIRVGEVQLVEGQSYQLTQASGSNTFVSMRSAGVLFEQIPEPGAAGLLGLATTVFFFRRRRRV